MSCNYGISLPPLPVMVDVESSASEAREISTLLNHKVLQDMEEVLKAAGWQETSRGYERPVKDEIILCIQLDHAHSLAHISRRVGSRVEQSLRPEEKLRQQTLLRNTQMACDSVVNEVFDRAYVRAIERATHGIKNAQVHESVLNYNEETCVTTMRIVVQLSA